MKKPCSSCSLGVHNVCSYRRKLATLCPGSHTFHHRIEYSGCCCNICQRWQFPVSVGSRGYWIRVASDRIRYLIGAESEVLVANKEVGSMQLRQNVSSQG